jgi:aryl-alcohol dehydrogenase-like predicted oxidoreductase
MAMTLPRRALGSTGMEVSLLGLGTVAFGRSAGLKYPRPVAIPDERELRALLRRARELGVNLIDTAPAYGASEARLGGLLHGERASWIIATKTGEEFIGGASRWDFSPRHTEASVLRSLERLRTDYLDVVLLHSNDADLDVVERSGALEALADLKRRGLVRAIGVSHKTVAGGLTAIARCDVLMTELSPDVRDQLAVVEAADAQGCGVIVKKALASGRATDPAASLRWVAAQSGVSSIVVGTTSVAHLEADARALAR